MGCGCSNRGGNANPAARQIVRQTNVAPSPFNQPVVQRTPQLAPPTTASANKNITYNVQPITAQQSAHNPVENNQVRRIAWDRTRREAVRRAMGR